MAVTNLTGTTWVFNSNIDVSSKFNYNINFTSGNNTFDSIICDYNSSPMSASLSYRSEFLGKDIIAYNRLDSLSWDSNDYKTINIIDGEDVSNTDLISYLNNNATQIIKPVDLTGYTVSVPSGWTASSGFGSFNLNYISNSNDCTELMLGYNNNKFGVVSPSSDSIIFSKTNYPISSIGSSSSFTITIFGGEDATDEKLIQWFVDNNATFTKDEPTGPSIQGSAVPGATSYALYEKKNNFYNMLAVSDAIDFNLGKLNLSGGTHKLVIKARAEDYEVSDYSNEVSYSVAADLITFTIAKTIYQAEQGMTWEQWVNSVYNTYGFIKTRVGTPYIANPYIENADNAVYYNNIPVTSSDTIIPDVRYVYGNLPGGSN